MATFAVSSLADAGPGTLRQAILDANAAAGVDLIDLTAVAGSIVLSSGEIQITEQLTIEGPGRDVLTIDAQQASRIFHATYTAIGAPLAIKGLTLANGKTTADGQGGAAVRLAAWADLTVEDCTVAGSVTEGKQSHGGAIYGTGDVLLIDSTVEGNRTLGEDADGGGVYSSVGEASLVRSTLLDNFTVGRNSEGGGVSARRRVSVTDSLVQGNHTQSESAEGGGVNSPDVSLIGSTIHGNSTQGLGAGGGGVHATDATIVGSTISENFTTGHSSSGGGLHATSLVLTDSMVRDNMTNAPFAAGGGVYSGSEMATITRSTITGNRTFGDTAPGGGLRAVRLTLVDSVVSNNRTAGDKSAGGGVRADISTTIVNSTIHGNATTGNESHGGGLLANGSLEAIAVAITDNSTSGLAGFGGGVVSTGPATFDRSTVSGNRTGGQNSSGGGIHAIAPLTIRNSTLSSNRTAGDNADGGGLIAFADLTLNQATISGNWTEGANAYGGGVAAANLGTATITAAITRSTIANNRTDHPAARGGGVWNLGVGLVLDSSIVAGNFSAVQPDIRPNGALSADWSLIEQTGLFVVGANNLIGVPAGLEPLASNGGAVMTHALSPGSAAIDAGNPSFMPPPEFDARGFAFARVVGGRIDIGAIESNAAWADFDNDGRVDGSDFLTWQRGLGGNASHPAGDANVDGAIDRGDLDVWRDQFGSSAEAGESPATEAGANHSLAGAEQSVLAEDESYRRAELIDAAMAVAATHAEQVDVLRLTRGRRAGIRRW